MALQPSDLPGRDPALYKEPATSEQVMKIVDEIEPRIDNNLLAIPSDMES